MGRIDAYCERLGPGFWAEPVNAVTSGAFLVAAAWMWGRWRGDALARALAAVLGAIAVGSFLFHTVATAWAAAADTAPILGFILLYVFAAHRRMWGQGPWVAGAFAALTVPWTLLLTPAFARLPGFEASAFYWPVPLLILVHAALLRRRAPAVARGLAAGAAILCLSLLFRSLDGALCPAWPLGTHFLWHLLNAVMLGWMVEVMGRVRASSALAPSRSAR